MRITTYLLSLALLADCADLIAQAHNWKEIQSIQVAAKKASIDQLNSIYAVRKGEVIKFDATGAELCRYSNKLIGEDVKLDVSNALKVILFAPSQMRLFFLDSRLGEMQEQIDLFQLGFQQITLAATSYSNGVWLYDPINFSLIRFNQNMEQDHKSLSLSQLLRIEFYPTDLIEVNKRVYLTDPEQGVFEFDVFGNFVRKIPIKGISKLVISDNRLFFSRGNQIYAFNLDTSDEEQLSIEISEQAIFDINRNRMIILNQDRLSIFEVTD